MTSDQGILFTLLAAVLALLIWGRWRYDLVAFAALVAALLLGVVPAQAAFTGFGHPAVIIIALVLVASRGLSRSGAIDLLARRLIDAGRSLRAHIGVMATIAAALSTLMNNVAALAVLMPVEIKAAKRSKRSPALSLMPLSFASILGGMVTLIGTPPNIVIATFRERVLGEPYAMFDFAPVGGVVALAGVAFVVLVGWRLIPAERTRHDTGQELHELKGYIAEAKVGAGAAIIGMKVPELDALAEAAHVQVIGLVRGGRRLPGAARRETVKENDLVVLEGSPDAIDEFLAAAKLQIGETADLGPGAPDLALVEVVVPEGARIVGRSAMGFRLLYRQNVRVLGISRKGKRLGGPLGKTPIQPGDLLLLLGPEEQMPDVVHWLGCLALAERGLEITQHGKAGVAVAVFAAAIVAASLALVPLIAALAVVVVAFVVLRIVPLSQLYEAIEWPVIVLLGALIPIGQALESSGGTGLIANAIVGLTAGLPAVAVLTILMVVTMTLSDVLNNVATALIVAPIGVDIAQRLDANPDTFLMGVAVAASCAFLTPIGHKNNTIILGPGGYQFGDYWRMGLPLEVIVLLVGIPMILWVWPL